MADSLSVFWQVVRDARGRRRQRHDRLIGHVGNDVRFMQKGNAVAQFVGGAGDRHQSTDRIGTRRVPSVIARRDAVDASAEQRMAGETANALALEEGLAAVIKRFLVLLSGHHWETFSLSRRLGGDFLPGISSRRKRRMIASSGCGMDRPVFGETG